MSSPGTSQTSILIVDPDSERRATLSNLLRQSGDYRVDAVSSKADALGNCLGRHPDLIVLSEPLFDWLSPSPSADAAPKRADSLAHDLKQPLQTIGLSLFALQRALEKNDIGQGRQLLAESNAALQTLADKVAETLSALRRDR